MSEADMMNLDVVHPDLYALTKYILESKTKEINVNEASLVSDQYQ
jgi:hypothetical protein